MQSPTLGTRIASAIGAIRRIGQTPLFGRGGVIDSFQRVQETPANAMAIELALGEPQLASIDPGQQKRFSQLFELEQGTSRNEAQQQADFEALFQQVSDAYTAEVERLYAAPAKAPTYPGLYVTRDEARPAQGLLLPMSPEMAGALMLDAAETLLLEQKVMGGKLDPDERQTLMRGVIRRQLRNRYGVDAGAIVLES